MQITATAGAGTGIFKAKTIEPQRHGGTEKKALFPVPLCLCGLTGPDRSGVVVGVDGDVFFREVAGPNCRVGGAGVAVEVDLYLLRVQRAADGGGVEGERDAATENGRPLQRQRAAIGIERDIGQTRGADDSPPVG